MTELASFAADGCEGGVRIGQHGRPRRRAVRDRRQGRQRPPRRPPDGETSVFATGLPPRPTAGIGGAMDVAFLGRTAYVLVTLAGPDFGQPDDVDGIYRIGRDGTATPVADIGAFSIANPPETDFFIRTGVQYSMQEFHGGFLVADGHHNRVLWVSRHGFVTELITFGNTVPTGWSPSAPGSSSPGRARSRTCPRTARCWCSGRASRRVRRGLRSPADHRRRVRPRRPLCPLAGHLGPAEHPRERGQPASENTGRLLRVGHRGGFETVVGELNRPTSLDFIGKSAFVVTLTEGAEDRRDPALAG